MYIRMNSQYAEIQRPVHGELTTRLHRINNNNVNRNVKTYKNRVAVLKPRKQALAPLQSERILFGPSKSKHITSRKNRKSRKSRKSRNSRKNRK